ncbi:MAG: lysostaphin resistance A-like protein [Candidatus Methanofastidiosia archaeon]
MNPSPTKSRAVFEIILAFSLTFIALWAFQLTPIPELQKDILHHSFLEYTIMILVPLLILFFTRKSFASYGITFQNLRYHLDVAFTCLAVVMPLSALGYAFLLPKLQTSYLYWDGALILSVLKISSLFLIAYLLKKKQTFSNLPSSNVILFLFFLVAVFSVAVFTTPHTKRISGFVFYLFFVGFGEEIMFRGYIQSRLNEAFGHPYQFFEVNLGWGLVITSLIFGLMHIINPYNPFNWWWGFWTFFSGLVLGFIREKTGSIVAPAIIHGLPQAFVILFFGLE